MVRKSFSPALFVVTSLFAAVVMAACGGGAAGGSSTAIPTSTPIPTYGIALPTSMLVVGGGEATSEATPAADVTEAADSTAEATSEATTEATAAAAASTSFDPALVERGKGRYDALTCATCHGANGEGTDDAKTLVGLALSEGEFASFMRSGGSLGTAHQYPANRLSDSGVKALYQYLLSLSTGS